MARYKVIALSVGGKNKVYDSGDLVDETNFPQENVASLVEQGFLAPIADDAQFPVDLSEAIEGLGDKKETGADGEGDLSEEDSEELAEDAGEAGSEIEAFDKITTKRIKKFLKEKGVTFDQNASKQALYDLLTGKE